MNYLNSEQKEKLEKILNLQNNIEASKEKQEERISSYDDYLSNKFEEEKMKKMMLIKKQKDKDQRDKKKKLEKKMNDWAHKQEKISERQIKQSEKSNISNNNDKNNNNDDNEEDNEDNNDYNEEFDISKYNVISLDNMKNDESNDNNNISNNNNEDTENNSKSNVNNEIICMICQRKFASEEKLALHEKLSELHKQNLNKLKLNNN